MFYRQPKSTSSEAFYLTHKFRLVDRNAGHDGPMKRAIEAMEYEGGQKIGVAVRELFLAEIRLDDIRQPREDRFVRLLANGDRRRIGCAIDETMQVGMIERVMRQMLQEIKNGIAVAPLPIFTVRIVFHIR